MQTTTTRACLQALLAKGDRPDLRGLTGVWELDLEGDQTWSLRVEDGRLSVIEGPVPGGRPDATLHMAAADFVRVARGVEHENLMTALLRGALRVDGNLRFAQRLDLLLPIPEDARGGEENKR